MDPATSSPPEAITQIIYLSIPADKTLNDAQSYCGGLWTTALDLIESSEGFRRLYWGRCLEQPEDVQLHVVRQTLNYHEIFRKSQAQTQLTALLHALGSSGSSNPIKAIRYVAMQDFTPNSQALGKGAPFTGSAIYLNPTAAWHEGAWPLWTHIVRYIDGCMGCCGGQILGGVELMGEPTYAGEVKVEGEKMERWEKEKWEGYLVYVGWESVDKHEAYHHTKHFAQHRVILGCGNAGFAEYGHVVFEGSRDSKSIARL